MSEHDDFLEELKPENWTETTTLHTPTLEATLDGGRLALLFPDGQRQHLERSDVEALTRFLDQYAGVEPLPTAEDPFPQGWQPTRVDAHPEVRGGDVDKGADFGEHMATIARKSRKVNQKERITAMAAIMVDARRNTNDDVGSLVAAALHSAASQLRGVEALVSGRPGSWEADIVRRMASSGGSADKHRVARLASLFVEMSKEGADGGDVLSQAMSQAVDTLGGLEQFAGNSDVWYHDLTNMGRQYSG